MPYAAAENLTARPVMTFSAATVLESLRHSYARLVVDSIEDLPLIAPFATTRGRNRPALRGRSGGIATAGLHDLMSGGEAGSGMLRTLLNDARPRADSPTGMVEVLPSGGPADELVRTVAFHTAQQRPPASEPDARGAGRGPAGAARLGGLPQDHLQSERPPGAPSPPRPGGRPRGGSLGDGPDLRHRGAAARSGTAPSPAAARGRSTVRSGSPGSSTPPRRFRSPSPPTSRPACSTSARRTPYSVRPMALDSAVLQTVSMVSALPPGGERSVPPALRSGGLSIIQEGPRPGRPRRPGRCDAGPSRSQPGPGPAGSRRDPRVSAGRARRGPECVAEPARPSGDLQQGRRAR